MFIRPHPCEARFLAVLVLLGGLLRPALSPGADELTASQRQDLKKSVELNARATALYQRGAYREAIPLLREALALRRLLFPKNQYPRGHPALAQSLNNLGFLLQAQEEFAEAEPFLRESLAMRRALYPRDKFPQGHIDLASSLNNLGFMLQAQGEYGKAEPFYREALVMRRALFPPEQFPHGHPDLARSLNNVGFLLQAQGESARSEPFFRAALAMRRFLFHKEMFPRGHPELAQNLSNLAVVLKAQAQYTRAELFAREALAMYRTLFPREEFPQGHPQLATSLTSLGVVLQEQGEYAKAEPFLREALAMRRALHPREQYPRGHPELAQGLVNLAALLQARGEYARAEPLYREALAMYRTHLLAMADGFSEVQALNFVKTLPLAHDAYLSVTRHLPATTAVYDELWQRKALFNRVLERRHLDLLASKDPEAHRLGRELRGARQLLAHLLLSPVKDSKEYARRMNALIDSKEDLEKRLVRQLRLAAPPPTVPPPSKTLADALPPNAVFLDIIRTIDFEQDPTQPGASGLRRTPRYVAFLIRAGRKAAKRVELGPAQTLEQAWQKWREAIVANKPDRAAAAGFARLAWEPLRKHLPADLRVVYLSADDALTQVPWAALPGIRPDTVLLEEHAIATVPHGPWLLEHLRRPPRPRAAEDRLLVIGGIAYDRVAASGEKTAGAEVKLRAPPGKRVLWNALPGTAREHEQIVSLARKVFRKPPLSHSGAAASTAQLEADLPRVRYAHLATHGFFADARFRSAFQIDETQHHFATADRRTAGARSPLVLSGLVLAGANCTGKDAAADRGILTAEALVGLNLHGLELAVLSACDTGVGDFQVAGGEGVYGLQRAFHLAGCKNVIASLWKVDDDATAALMGVFYRHLWVGKLPPLEALRQAQLYLYRNPSAIATLGKRRGDLFVEVDLPRETAKPGEQPRHAPTRQWAAFVLSGAGR